MKTAMREGSYLDTSFVFKFYLNEPNSDEALAWLQQNRNSVFVSPLSDIELITSFLRQDSIVAARQAVDDYFEDLRANIYVKLEMDAEVFALAAEISERYSREYKLRSLDILHLATVLRYGIPAIGTYDKRLAEAAVALGLKVFPDRS